MKIILKTLFIIFLIVLLYPAEAQAWFKHYGGASVDDSKTIQQTSDGGYIVAGNTSSYTYGSNDFAIYKLTSSGSKVWFKHYGGAGIEGAFSIQQTSDGGYIVAGQSTTFSYGGYDFAIYMLDSSGNKVWFKHYGGSEHDYGRSIDQSSDGGYIVAGYTASYTHGSDDFAIYKLDSLGNKVWFKHYGGSGVDRALAIQQTSDGGYIVAGYTASYSHGNYDFAIYRLDSGGSKTWFKHYGGTYADSAYSIQQTSDGCYIVAGYSVSYTHGSADFAIYKLNSIGNKVWFRYYGGANEDYGYSVHQTSDNGYVVAGETNSYSHGIYDFAIYRLNSDGDKVWFKHYGGSESDKAESIQQTSDGGYIVTGPTQSYTYGSYDFGIYKLDSDGNK